MKRNHIQLIILFLSVSLFSSCDDFFDVNPDDVLLEKDYPGTQTELYSSYMGIASKVQAVADQVIFLEGLRGNFLEPTSNATNDIIDVYNYREKEGNELTDPAGFYEIILNANDYIDHARKFKEQYPTAMDESIFNGLVGSVLRFKVWSYLSLAKIYGKAIWTDDSFVEYKDLSDYPETSFDRLITNCIELIDTGVVINQQRIDGKGSVNWADPTVANSILNTNDLTWKRHCPPAYCLLTELYLFAGQYQKALDSGFAMLNSGTSEGGAAKPSFQITKSEYNGEWLGMFSTYSRLETIFMMSYDYDKKQTNRLIEYFSNDQPNRYLVRPSQAAMDLFNAQTMSDGTAGDTYRGKNRTFSQRNGEWTVRKYCSGVYDSKENVISEKIFRNEVPVMLYRASDVHLWIAEALIHLGRFREALKFFNGGFNIFWSGGKFIDETVNGVVVARYSDFPATLYGDGGSNISQGVRGRVSLKAVGEDIIKNPSVDPETDKKMLDKLVLDEACLELACEGRAYYTMMRIAKRWQDPALLADRVAEKYADKEGMRALLMNPENWYVKYSLE